MSGTLIAAVGLKREAAVVGGAGVVCVAGGGDPVGLRTKLAEALRRCRARAIVSVGIGGALAPELAVGDWVVADRIVGDDARWTADATLVRELRQALPAAAVGSIASGNVIVTSAADKAALHARTGTLAVDMESHVAAAVAAAHGLPFAALRVVSDAADHALPLAVLVSMRPDGGLNLPAILWSLMKAPGQLPALIRTGREAEVAFRQLALLGRHDLLGRLGVGDLDLGQLALDVV